jgi:hypothetical protein
MFSCLDVQTVKSSIAPPAQNTGFSRWRGFAIRAIRRTDYKSARAAIFKFSNNQLIS